MYRKGLLLDSSLSDGFGSSDIHIPRDLEDRIIKNNTNIVEIDKRELGNFLISYSPRIKEETLLIQGVYEYLLDRFFEKIKGKFDSVERVGGENSKPQKAGGYTFKYRNRGRNISVYDSSMNSFTGIPRIYDIRKGNTRNVIICDIRSSGNSYNVTFRKKITKRVKATRALLEGKYTLSYMLICGNDLFKEFLGPYEHPMYKSRASALLSPSPNNLFLVYSENSQHLKKFGQEVFGKM